MLVSELRVGNFINHIAFERLVIPHKEVFHLNNAVNEDVINYCSSKLYQPIPLTEEWLVKFGFEYDDIDGNSGYWKLGNFEVVFGEDGCSYNWDLKIEFVHQLQNLVFALTGEELTLKQTDNI